MPTRNHEFLDEARAEQRHAQTWYEIRSLKVAERFVAEIERGIRAIIKEPQRWPRYGRRVRYFRLRRFPYLIIYRFDETTVTVIAFAHTSRRPGYWRKRLR